MNRKRIQTLALCTALAAAGLSMAQGSSKFEAAPALPGAELASPSLLKGPYHQVAEPVTVEGNLGRFVIDSRFGKFTVRGSSLLAERVGEMQAIEALQRVRGDAAFGKALGSSVVGVGKFTAGAVADPGKAVESIAQGLGSVLGNVGHLAKSGASYVGDKAGDIGKRPQPGTGTPPAAGGDAEPPSFTGDPLGYNRARREWAHKLGIDPYTSNPVLRPLLNDAATATFAGNFAVGVTLGAVVAPLNYARALDETVRLSVWNKSPIDLEQENQKKLAALGVQGRPVRDLFRNRWVTPSLQTSLVARLGVFGKIGGIESVVNAATAAQGESRARFLVESLDLLGDFHQRSQPLVKIMMNNLVPIGVTADGSQVVAVAIDYGSWDEATATFAASRAFSAPRKTLLVAGRLSARATQSLEAGGWKLQTGLKAR